MSTLNLRAVLGFDGRGFEMGLARAESGLKKFSHGAIGDLKSRMAAAFSIGALTAGGMALINSVVGEVDKIKDAASELGDVSTDQAQGLAFILRRNNADIEQGIQAFNQLAKARDEALQDPEGKAAQAFAFFGIKGDDMLKGRIELFEQMSARMRETSRTTAELTALMDIFGTKLASKLRPSLTDDLMSDMVGEARKAGELIEKIRLERIKEGSEKFDALKRRGVATGGNVLGGMADMDRQTWQDVLSFGPAALAMDFLNIKRNKDDAQRVKAAQEAERAQLAELRAAEEMQLKELATAATAERKAKAEKEIADIKAKAAEIEQKLAFGALSNAEKRQAIEREIATLKAEKEAGLWDVNKSDAAMYQLRLAEARQRLAQVPADAERPDVVNSQGFRPPSDSLIKVGNFLGSSGTATINGIAQKQLDRLVGIEKNTRRLIEVIATAKPFGSLSDYV